MRPGPAHPARDLLCHSAVVGVPGSGAAGQASIWEVTWGFYNLSPVEAAQWPGGVSVEEGAQGLEAGVGFQEKRQAGLAGTSWRRASPQREG